MDSSQVSAALKASGSSDQAGPFLEALASVAQAGFADAEAANTAARAAADLVMALGKQAQQAEALRVVNGYIDLASKIPCSQKALQFLAFCALEAAGTNVGALERIEATLLSGDAVEGYRFSFAADRFASLGLVERAMRYTGIAMAEGIDADALFHRPHLKDLYGADAAFKALVDSHTARQQARKAYFATEPDPRDFAQVKEAAWAELTREKESFRARRVTAIAAFKDAPHREEVARLLSGGFDLLEKQAMRKEELINECAFDALARAIARWQDPAWCDLLMRKFVFVTDPENLGGRVHYELVLVGGTLALSLAALGYRGDLSPFERFLTEWEWRYRGDDFVMKTRYAVWMITKDAAGAAAWLSDPDNVGGYSYAACALADLNDVASRAAVYEAARKATNPVTLNALAEAYGRLGRQQQAPPWEERMIHLFGEMTETEKELSGGETDDQFLLRLRAQQQNARLGALVDPDSPKVTDR